MHYFPVDWDDTNAAKNKQGSHNAACVQRTGEFSTTKQVHCQY